MEKVRHPQGIVNRQQSSLDWLQELPPLPRFVLGLFAVAAFSWYVPPLLVTLTTGAWKGGLGMWLANAIGISVLMAINLIANKFNRVLLVGAVCAVLVGCYEATLIARTMQASSWQSWLLTLIVPPIIFLLNGYLLSKYKRIARLESAVRNDAI